ncbi:RNA polymerase subunit sigma-24 [Paenibacillus sp. FSL K6-2524]|uniref:RNA polymerase subunit sigma-24 n=1 Tax=Paenibacillus sp. FSL K6-2524 TaxID=2954516 RepID=UPI0030F87601
MTNEQQVVEQLTGYGDLIGRIQVLSTYNIGAGITVSRLNEDDQLQALHRELRGLPSYMYLTGYEQKLEQAASAYLTRLPAGVKAQKRAVPVNVADEEDRKMLQDVRSKIQKVIAARGYDLRDDIDVVLDRLTELQDLQTEQAQIDGILEVMSEQHGHYANLLRLHYIRGLTWDKTIVQMDISKSVFYRWRPLAVKKYAILAGWEKVGKITGTKREQKLKSTC